MAALNDLINQPAARRDVLKWLLGFSVVTTVIGIIGPILAYLMPVRESGIYGGPIAVGRVEDFPAGTGAVVTVNGKPVIIVNTKAGGVKPFSAVCTHLGCVVYWDKAKGVIHSPCHDGLFSPVTGAVVSGPPPRPLPAYESQIKDGQVYVGKPLGQIYGT